MQITKISNLAKVGMVVSDYENLMLKINNKQLNSARLFIEDKIEIISSKKKPSMVDMVRMKHLQKLDSIITEEHINKLDREDATVS